MIIAVDFDGTIVEHKYPSIGKEKPFAVETLRALAADGHTLILWTVRHGKLLDDALAWCRERKLVFFAVNSNYPEGSLFGKNSSAASPKIEADVYIDDRNLGGLPDWGEIYEIITKKSAARHKHRKSRHSRPRWLEKLLNR
jgi:hypothetical protein